ncbi:hypothetical protein BDY21DRAFT_374446 [Lineolata rhizophorae]|uniref:Uncharacterized protein n=1 Tax=Lineolata rhizophorae TaxID=578093 RepID=A0A6A6NR80_9PEZI|nr:hypothetical protein BDY21DRAFT_374446 [Lineolata rhizophorae]
MKSSSSLPWSVLRPGYRDRFQASTKTPNSPHWFPSVSPKLPPSPASPTTPPKEKFSPVIPVTPENPFADDDNDNAAGDANDFSPGAIRSSEDIPPFLYRFYDAHSAGLNDGARRGFVAMRYAADPGAVAAAPTFFARESGLAGRGDGGEVMRRLKEMGLVDGRTVKYKASAEVLVLGRIPPEAVCADVAFGKLEGLLAPLGDLGGADAAASGRRVSLRGVRAFLRKGRRSMNVEMARGLGRAVQKMRLPGRLADVRFVVKEALQGWAVHLADVDEGKDGIWLASLAREFASAVFAGEARTSLAQMMEARDAFLAGVRWAQALLKDETDRLWPAAVPRRRRAPWMGEESGPPLPTPCPPSFFARLRRRRGAAGPEDGNDAE